jgi:hypothetical protein
MARRSISVFGTAVAVVLSLVGCGQSSSHESRFLSQRLTKCAALGRALTSDPSAGSTKARSEIETLGCNANYDLVGEETSCAHAGEVLFHPSKTEVEKASGILIPSSATEFTSTSSGVIDWCIRAVFTLPSSESKQFSSQQETFPGLVVDGPQVTQATNQVRTRSATSS